MEDRNLLIQSSAKRSGRHFESISNANTLRSAVCFLLELLLFPSGFLPHQHGDKFLHTQQSTSRLAITRNTNSPIEETIKRASVDDAENLPRQKKSWPCYYKPSHH